MKTLSSVIKVIGLFFMLIIIVSFGKLAGYASKAGLGYLFSPSIEEELAETAKKYNNNLPMMVDKDTRLDYTIGGSGKTFTYLYTLPSNPSTDYDRASFRAEITPIVKANVCKLTGMKPFFKAGITAFYVYRGNDGVEIARLAITPQDCGITPN
ncbi:MAG: hypothetical protein ACOYMG_21095 [Candidatus Methylumidiphilus sp.]